MKPALFIVPLTLYWVLYHVVFAFIFYTLRVYIFSAPPNETKNDAMKASIAGNKLVYESISSAAVVKSTPTVASRRIEDGLAFARQLTTHYIWFGTMPFRAVLLMSIDASLRYAMGRAVRVHVSVEEGIPEDLLAERKRKLKEMLSIFKGEDVKIVYIDDATSFFKDTPLEKMNLTQRYLGGRHGSPVTEFYASHCSDVMKVVIQYKEGGVVKDDDSIQLAEYTPLFLFYGNNILASEQSIGVFNNCCLYLASGFVIFEKRAPVIYQTMLTMMDQLNSLGLDQLFPENGKERKELWAKIGPVLISRVHCENCKKPRVSIRVKRVHSAIRHFLKRASRVDPILTWAEYAERNHVNMTQIPTWEHQYAVLNSEYFIPAHWKAVYFLVSKTSVKKHIHILDSAFDFHIFGSIKWNIQEYILQRGKYPVLDYLHRRTCKHLCDLEAWKQLPEFPSYTKRVTHNYNE